MSHQPNILPGERFNFTGEVHSLLEQVGSADKTVSLASVFPQLWEMTSLACLQQFLRIYRSQVLFPLELPAIHRAFGHACRHECRELIALDQALSNETKLRDLAAASQSVGALHLRHLRPLRDHRLVQRYIQAIDDGQALGWHTLVYGVTLAVYSIPGRQGLIAYATQTFGGFVEAAACRLHLLPEDCDAIVAEELADLPSRVEELLAPFVV